MKVLEKSIIYKLKVFMFVFINMVFISVFSFADTFIIVNKNISRTDISEQMIRKIYLKQKTQWNNGVSIEPVMLKRGKAFNEFVRELVGMNPSQFSTYWKRALFTGTGIPPKSFSSEKDLIEYVSKTQGAIGHISFETEETKVKIVIVK